MGDLFIGVTDETLDLVKVQGLVFFFDQKIQKQVLSLDHSPFSYLPLSLTMDSLLGSYALS
ncbi:predicted protein [Enterococcus casseliflavus EC10]|nr:hypothetical protein [Listeria monocytogenes]EAG2874935.1 hypothetical protein [Listeria monocytogenes]EEV34713.1 predicted protein [Enterococcus casseliflavus EC10]